MMASRSDLFLNSRARRLVQQMPTNLQVLFSIEYKTRGRPMTNSL